MKNIKRIFLSAPLLCSCLLLVAIGTASAQERGGLSISSKFGTLGLGLELAYPFHEKFSGRLVFNQADEEFDDTLNGAPYEGDLELSTYGLIGDWYPVGNRFKLSIGVLANDNKLTAGSRDADFYIGGHSLDGNMEVQTEWKSLAPYVGLGWSSRTERGFNFNIEVGALLQGDAILRAEGAVTEPDVNCQFTVNSSGNAAASNCSGTTDIDQRELEEDLAMEHVALIKDLEEFDIYPVISLGVSYGF